MKKIISASVIITATGLNHSLFSESAWKIALCYSSKSRFPLQHEKIFFTIVLNHCSLHQYGMDNSLCYNFESMISSLNYWSMLRSESHLSSKVWRISPCSSNINHCPLLKYWTIALSYLNINHIYICSRCLQKAKPPETSTVWWSILYVIFFMLVNKLKWHVCDFFPDRSDRS